MTGIKHPAVIAVTIAALAVLLWGFCLWPTMYRYEKLTHRLHDTQRETIVRTNRITGESRTVFPRDK